MASTNQALSVTKFHMRKYQKYYAAGILVPEVHAQLVESMEGYCQVANIPDAFVYRIRMDKYCSADEINYVKTYKRTRRVGIAGFMYAGRSVGVDERMMAMTGAFLRNYIDARLMTIQQVTQKLKEGEDVDASVVLIPNFVSSSARSKPPGWVVDSIQGWLLSRYARQRPIVAYIKSMVALRASWGDVVRDHFANRFDGLDRS